MAISLGDALGISEVRLPGQSVVAFNFVVRRLCHRYIVNLLNIYVFLKFLTFFH